MEKIQKEKIVSESYTIVTALLCWIFTKIYRVV